jgi:hypothetical protein
MVQKQRPQQELGPANTGRPGNSTNTDLLVLYHDKPNGRKKVITEGHQASIPKSLTEKALADQIMMVRSLISTSPCPPPTNTGPERQRLRLPQIPQR